jgi:uncharacterized membrane protein YgcG
MSDLTPQMQVALGADTSTIFLCGELNLPDYDLRLLEASGEVTFGGVTFKGYDEKYGVIDSVDAPSDGFGDQAPQLSFTINPPDATAVAELSNPTMQGSRIRIWLGAIDPDTKGVVADPLLLFDGELDVPSLAIDKSTREVTYDCVSAFEILFENEEGSRLSDSNQQEFWPGDTGLSDVTGIVKTILWGPGERVSGSGGSYGGGGGGGREFESGRNVRER